MLPDAAKNIKFKKKRKKVQSAAGAKRSSWLLGGDGFMQRGDFGWALKDA